MKPYSPDLRKRIVECYLAGNASQAEVAEKFSVSPSSVAAYLRLYRETGALEPKPHAGGPAPKLDEAARRKLRARVERYPDATLESLCNYMGGVISVAAMWQTLRSMGARLKKNSTRQ